MSAINKEENSMALIIPQSPFGVEGPNIPDSFNNAVAYDPAMFAGVYATMQSPTVDLGRDFETLIRKCLAERQLSHLCDISGDDTTQEIVSKENITPVIDNVPIINVEMCDNNGVVKSVEDNHDLDVKSQSNYDIQENATKELPSVAQCSENDTETEKEMGSLFGHENKNNADAHITDTNIQPEERNVETKDYATEAYIVYCIEALLEQVDDTIEAKTTPQTIDNGTDPDIVYCIEALLEQVDDTIEAKTTPEANDNDTDIVHCIKALIEQEIIPAVIAKAKPIHELDSDIWPALKKNTKINTEPWPCLTKAKKFKVPKKKWKKCTGDLLSFDLSLLPHSRYGAYGAEAFVMEEEYHFFVQQYRAADGNTAVGDAKHEITMNSQAGDNNNNVDKSETDSVIDNIESIATESLSNESETQADVTEKVSNENYTENIREGAGKEKSYIFIEPERYWEDRWDAYYFDGPCILDLEYDLPDKVHDTLVSCMGNGHTALKRLRTKNKYKVRKVHKAVKTKNHKSLSNGSHKKKMYMHHRLVKLDCVNVYRRHYDPPISVKKIDRLKGINNTSTMTCAIVDGKYVGAVAGPTSAKTIADARRKTNTNYPIARPAGSHTLTAYNADGDLEAEMVNLMVSLQNRDITPEDYDMLLRLDERIKARTLNKETLSKFKTDVVTEEHIEDACTVCMENYQVGQDRKFLPCGHAFHAGCIDMWLSNSSMNCPLDGTEVSL